MEKKSKNSGKFSTTSNYSHKPENSVQRRLKRPDQAFYSGGGGNSSANNGAISSNTNSANVTSSPTNNTFTSDAGPHTARGDSGGGNFRRDKKPPLAVTNSIGSSNNNNPQLPPNCPSNIESMPPRFQRKWLQENNLPLDFFENQQNQQQSPANRTQTLPNKGNRGNRNNFYGSSNANNYGNNGKSGGGSHGRPLRSPMRSRSRSSDQRGSRHSSRNSSLERSSGNGTRIFSNSNNKPDYERRHGTRSPDYPRGGGGGRGDNNKNYGNKGWKQNYNNYKAQNTNMPGEQQTNEGRRDIADLPPRGKDSVIFDWSLEVEEDEKRKRNENLYHGRRSNRSHSRSNMDRNPPQSSDFDHFKVPYNPVRSRSRKNSRSSSTVNSRENSNDRGGAYNRFSSSRENSSERFQRDPTNWRTPLGGKSDVSDATKIAEMTKQFVDAVDLKKERNSSSGIIVLPNSTMLVKEAERERTTSSVNKRLLNGGNAENLVQRTLFDPKNPEKPIIVTRPQSATNRSVPTDNLLDYKNFSANSDKRKNRTSISAEIPPGTHPTWYDPNSEAYKKIHNAQLIENLREIDFDLMRIVDSKELFREWQRYNDIRAGGQQCLIEFLRHDIKFCEIENVEQHCWKMLFYNIIELLRRPLGENIDEESKKFYKTKLMEIIDPGVKYWEQIIPVLEARYNFKLDEFVGANALARMYQPLVAAEDQKFVKLALVATQKVLIYLGDLARYKELVNESSNFSKAKQWYTKAQQVLPKNGRPYNQLALLSVYSKRKIDAVYFYMRSLMSSNPFQSARESLIALFDETRKKYENSQKRRDEKNRARLKEKEHRFDGGSLRRENWIHPEGGSRMRRFAPLDPMAGQGNESSDDDDLSQLDALEVNKRFITSFLHIQGKLITKIGMESFVQCAIQMLREFRALIQNSPIAITCHRLLQLIALNMFAIDCSQLKDTKIAGGARSEVQECAITIGLLMFGIILERFLAVVQEAIQQQQKTQESDNNPSLNDTRKSILPEDAKVMLPAIKVWCDWMTRQQNIWNPPPSFNDYAKVAAEPFWTNLAAVITLLDNNEFMSNEFSTEPREGFDLVKLHEDFTFAGFTPLLDVKLEPIYVKQGGDVEVAENEVRLQKILNFGKNVLCLCSPAVLERRTLDNGSSEYVSVVQNIADEPSDSEILIECISDEEDNAKEDDLLPSTTLLRALGGNNRKSQDNSCDDAPNCANDDDAAEHDETPNSNAKNENNNETINNNDNAAAAEIRRLLRRKDELLRKQRMQEKYNERLQDILRQSTVALCMEVRPRFLVPDTNCFVDYLPRLKAIGDAYPLYQLMIPLVVISELEGLSKGFKPPSITTNDVQSLGVVPINVNNYGRTEEHAKKVAAASKEALEYLKSKPPAVKLVTTKGHQIKTFISSEDDSSEPKTNDDKILDTALNLCKPNAEKRIGDTRYISREVVLITKDRNLRVKALTNDLPVRELLDFVKWAGLGS
ncbi:telomerase-binding protein EST1A isoform X2 [Culicoides brevitarsis]|uniref:telomerase-binding protein EST1A isoform X2 n=1 Tax=Culicoides brevitarsis TaxID=469753 RepID=UPI00307BAEF5